jgi:DNA replication protein DnaC
MKENKQMANDKYALLRANLKQLKLPTMAAEFEKLAREAAGANEGFEQYLLRLSELEVAARASKAMQTRIRNADFPVHKDFDTFDFTAVPHVNKPKVLELARGEWIEQKTNVCMIGSTGTGKTHLAIALGLAACRQGKRVQFATAADLVLRLEQAQKQYSVGRKVIPGALQRGIDRIWTRSEPCPHGNEDRFRLLCSIAMLALRKEPAC